MTQPDRFQALLDAKLLGMVTRNIAALMYPQDIATRTKFNKAKFTILRRYGAENVNDCFRIIAKIIREQSV